MSKGIRAERWTARSRSFLLWFATIVLVVVAFAASPAYALADDGESLPHGVLTLAESDDLNELFDTPSNSSTDSAYVEKEQVLEDGCDSESHSDSSSCIAAESDETKASGESATVTEHASSCEKLPEANKEKASNETSESQHSELNGSASNHDEPARLVETESTGLEIINNESAADDSMIATAAPNAPPTANMQAEPDCNESSANMNNGSSQQYAGFSAVEESDTDSSSDCYTSDDSKQDHMVVASSITTQSNTVTVTIVFGGLTADSEPDTEGPALELTDVFCSRDWYNVKYEDESGNERGPVVATALAGGKPIKITIFGVEWNALRYQLNLDEAEDLVITADFYRLGYTLNGGLALYEYGLANGDYITATGTLEEVMSFIDEDMVDCFDSEGNIVQFTLLMGWTPDPYVLEIDFTEDNKFTETFNMDDDVSEYLVEITSENASDYGIDYSAIPPNYEFAGYVLKTNEPDTAAYIVDNGDYYSVGPDDEHGPVPVVKVPKGKYTYRQMLFAAMGGQFPYTRFDEEGKRNSDYPQWVYHYASEVEMITSEVVLVPVFKEKSDDDPVSFSVEYYKTDSDGNALSDTSSATKPYDKKSATAETQSTLGESVIPTPTDKTGYTVTFKGWKNADGTVTISAANDWALAPLWGSGTPSGTYKLYAIWDLAEQYYTVEYYSNYPSGVSAPGTVSYTESAASKKHKVSNLDGDTVKFAKEVDSSWTPKNYKFAGWARTSDIAAEAYLNTDTTASVFDDALDTDGNKPKEGSTVKLYAKWTYAPTTFTVTFSDGEKQYTGYEYNSGDSAPTNLGTDVVNGKTVPTPTKTGYVFDGWNNGDGTKVAEKNNDTMGDYFKNTVKAGDSITLTAIWKPIKYTVNWYAKWTSDGVVEGVTYPSSSDDAIEYGAGVELYSLIGNIDSDVYNSLIQEVTITENKKDFKYTFVGWYLAHDSKTAWNAPAAGAGSDYELDSLTLEAALAKSLTTHTEDLDAGTGTITIYGIWQKTGSWSAMYIANTKSNSPTVPAPPVSETVFDGEDYKVSYVPNPVNGFTFTGWKHTETGDVYTLENMKKSTKDATNTVYSVKGTFYLEAQWTPNKVNIVLDKNTTDSNVSLNEKSPKTFAVKWYDGYTHPENLKSTVALSDLVTSTPTRAGYEFKGWAKTSKGGVIISSTKNYDIEAADAPQDGDSLTLYAIWEQLLYKVEYYANGTGVEFKTNDSNTTKASPYTWGVDNYGNATLSRDADGLDTPDITATRDWYNFVGWGTTANATEGIKSTNKLGDLYDAQSGATGRTLKLYAIWQAITFTVHYEAADGNGTVNPITEVISLATGKAINPETGVESPMSGSTATANTASGYKLATPTWTEVDGTVPEFLAGNKPEAVCKPTIDALRNYYNIEPTKAEITFKAHFAPADFAYTIQAFLQKADGTWGDTPDITIPTIGTDELEAPLNSAVAHSDTISTDLASMNGKALWRAPLLMNTTESISNDLLFDFEPSKGTLGFTVTTNTATNVLKLYYSRKTYELEAAFQTKNPAGSVIASKAPSGMKSTPESFITRTNAVNADATSENPKFRWGQSVPVGTPSLTGYTFSWSVTRPTTFTGTTPGSSFVLTAADMARIVTDSTPKAVLTGSFQVETYTITLKDTGENSMGNWPETPGTAGPGLASSSKTASKQVESNEKLGTWVVSPGDLSTNEYYFAGWRDVANPSADPISSESLSKIENWSGDKSYTAVWLRKMVISYDPGDLDSEDNSKAAWGFKSVSLNVDMSATNPGFIKTSDGRFVTLYTSAMLDDNGNPKGADGWEFDYWTVSDMGGTYGHASAIGTGLYLEQDDSQLFKLNRSWNFTAHWKGTNQKVTISNSGKVKNNTANEDTITATVSGAGEKNLATDTEIDLTSYTPTGVPSGYTFLEWKWTWKHKDSNGVMTTETGTYAKNSKFNVKVGEMTLEPVFNENTVTFKYELGSGSDGKGSIAPSGSDVVYAVKHNGINDHTASSKDPTAYDFVNWTYQSNAFTNGVATLTKSMMDIGATEVLTGDRTYYANFKTKQYTLRFSGKGTTDGVDKVGSVVASGTGVGSQNDFTVDWNTKIPSGGIVTVTPPEGYELDGWIVDGAGSPQVFAGGGSTDNQGVYNYVVTGDHVLTAHFKLSTAKGYTVRYSFDPENISKFAGTADSRAVSWGEDVRPTVPRDATPEQSGYKFEGWYVDAAYSKKVEVVGPDFGTIYDYLVNAGASNVETGDKKAITIYAKWTASKFTVAYDLYGNIADDASTPNDDVVVTGTIVPKTDVSWNDPASTFKKSTGFNRPGYYLSGWYATIDKTEGGTTETANPVNDDHTYGKLAANDDKNKTVTLHAIWASETFTVKYDYNDADFASVPTPVKLMDAGWAEVLNFYTLGNAPTYDGYKFNGWDVRYNGDNGSGGVTPKYGTRITAPGNTTIRDLVGGDIKAIGSTPIITFIASWTAQSSYYFQDRLIHYGGDYTDRDITSTKTVDGNTNVPFSEYGTVKDSYYDGYDFDDHITKNEQYVAKYPAFPKTTPNQITVGEGTSEVYYVYYLERAYEIEFTGADVTYKTSGNPWKSAPVTLPSVEPKRAGYSFGGWYLTNGEKEGLLDASTTLASLTNVYASAPAAGTKLTAVAKWVEDTVTIAWKIADSDVSYGSISPVAGSVTRTATESTAVAPITATPASSDYEFDKWTYSYVDDEGNTITGEVKNSSPFASLSGEKGVTLTPNKWAMNDGDSAVWHDITFTANFALSGSLKVTVEYYFEDGNNLGTYVLDDDKTDTYRNAKDGEVYTVTPETFAGYTLNDAKSDLSHTYLFDDSTTHTFKVYLDAMPHEVTYAYVKTDGTTIQDTPPKAASLATFNNGTFYTGQTHVVSAAPTLEGYTFKGWYRSTAYNGANISGTSITVGADDILIVGTWEENEYTVRFTDDMSSAAHAAGTTVTAPSAGFKVKHGKSVSSTKDPEASTLEQLGVIANPNGQAYTLTGWEVLVNGVSTGEKIGASDPLSYPIKNNTTFQAVWSETYRVIYTRGLHGSFTDVNDSTKTLVESPKLTSGSNMFQYTSSVGTVDDNGKPNAVDGWEFVGWGRQVSGTWTFYFDDDEDIDYGAAKGMGTNVNTGLPATVTSNIEFVGFYKALERTLAFSRHEYDSSKPVGEESLKDFNPAAQYASSVTTTTVKVKTGAHATMWDADTIEREGYTLVAWTDGKNSYAPGSTTEFTMPELAEGTTLWLYPVFGFSKIEITYDVHSDSTGKGDVDRKSDTKSNATQTIVGSKPVDNPGYKFDYWTKDDGTEPLGTLDGLQSDERTLIPHESGTYHAHFKNKKYDFTMSKNADPVGSQEVLPETALPSGKEWTDTITLEEPTRPGYTFTGWNVYKSSDWTTTGTPGTPLHTKVPAGTVTVSSLSDPTGMAQSLTLVPTWDPIKYSVKFEKNNSVGTGAISDWPEDLVNIEYSKADIVTTAPSRVGYTFTGWTTDAPNGSTREGTNVTYAELVDGDPKILVVTLTANWEPIKHQLKYQKGDGDTWTEDTSKYPDGDPAKTGTSADNAFNVAIDSTITLRGASTISKSGWKLMGWSDGTNQYKFDADGHASFTVPNNDTELIVLTPIWQEFGEYSVFFSAGVNEDDTPVTDAVLPSDRENIKFTANVDTSTPTRKGWKFLGWTNNKGGATTAAAAVPYSELANGDDSIKEVTLTATWQKNADYAVTFHQNADGDEVDRWPDDRTGLSWDSDVPTKALAGTPRRAGYTFRGWTIRDNSSPSDGMGAVLGNTDTNYYSGDSAKFSALAYNVDSEERKHLHLWAQWTEKKYSVIYDGNKPESATGEIYGMPTENPKTNLLYSAKNIEVPTLTLDGYDFGGWTNVATGYTTVAGKSYTYAELAGGNDNVESVTLKAIWTPIEHYLTYELGTDAAWSSSGSDYPTDDPAYSAAQPEEKAKDAIPTATDAKVNLRGENSATLTGFKLMGWKDKDALTEYRFEEGATQITIPTNRNVTLLPIWEGMPYNLRYILNKGSWVTSKITDGGAENPGAPISYRVKKTVIPRAENTVTRDGYTLVGWREANGTEHKFGEASETFEMPAEDVELSPIWSAMTYVVTFAANDSEGSSKVVLSTMPENPQSGNYDSNITHGEPTRTGYEFGGWDVFKTADYANPSTAVKLGHVGSGTSTYAALAGDPAISALTLVAIWTPETYGVTYVLDESETPLPSWVTANIKDGGASNPKMQVGYDTDATVNVREADTVSRPGYTLAGWKTSNSPEETPTQYLFDDQGHASFTMPAAKVILYAVWSRNAGYTVVFDGNAPTENIVPGATISNVPPDQPTEGNVLEWDGPNSNVYTYAPSFPGYQFKGWTVYDSDDVVINDTDVTPLSGPSYNFNVLAGGVDSDTHKHLKLVGNWIPVETYNVKFLDGVEDSGDPDHPFTPVTAGTMPLDAIGITYIKTVDYHAPSRLGYTFDGWAVKDITDPNNPVDLSDIDAGTGPYYQLAGNRPDRKTLQLTAKWIAKRVYNVHFVDKPENDKGTSPVNNGNFRSDFPDMEGIAWDDTVVVYPEPTRAGYDFMQWAVTNTTDPENVKSIGKIAKEDIGTFLYSELAINYMTALPDDAITHVTLTAIWKAHEWTVTYIVNKASQGTGTWNKSEITDKGKNSPDNAMVFAVDDVVDLRLANTLRLSGYTLVGWQDDETAPTNIYMLDSVTSFTMPDENVKLYPIWEVKTYKVVFDENKPAAATDTEQIVTGMPVTQWEKDDVDGPMTWTGTVDTKHPSLPGYTFKGWTIENAELTGALVGLLDGVTYTFNQLAITDNDAHTTLKLIAQWEPAKYRVTYVDPVDADGVAVDPVTVIATDPTKLWGDKVAITSPFEFDPAYTGKSEDDWEFVGWYVKDVSDNMVLIGASDNTTYSVLAALEGLTLADSATDDGAPALVLYAGWTRRVPFIVDYVKRTEGGTVETIESNTTLTGLDGDDIATKWATTVLDLGDNHRIAGFKYNRSDSAPGIVGTLSASGETLHLVLYYDELLGYVVTYDAAPGKNAAGNTTADAASPAWDSPSTNFVPVDGDWTYVGHKISHWTYGPTGTEYTFPAGGSSSLTFADIARAIFGDAADGSQGIDLNDDGIIDTPVVLHAVWVERTDYKVKYDDNYAQQDDKVKSGITDGRFLERTEGSTYKPGDKENVAWSEVDIEPTDIDDIVEPGVKGGIALYEIEGWNYLSKDGVQKPAEGKSFAEIVADMYVDEREPVDNEITLYARWKEIVIELKYTPTMLQVDTNGNLVLDGSGNVIVIGNGGGTVSRSSETVSAVTGGNVSGAKLLAEGATATANPGYHFVGWRRVGDNTIVYAPGMNPATLSASSLLMAMATGGFNVLPDGTIEGASLYRVAQNADDGYWHGEEYQALFAQNEIAILHYDKNAEDATGSIPDVEEPAGTLLTLSDGSGFKRTYWTLVGWNTKPDGTGTPYALSEANWPLPTGETTLYAQWVKNKAKLTYVPNGTDVTGIPEGIEDEWGSTHGVSKEAPKRKHYTFVGWNTEPDGTGTWYEGGEDVLLPGDGITLHAQWKINTYVVGPTEDPTPGGKVTGEPTEVEHGGYLPKGEIVAIPDPGYHVERWKYTMIDEDGNVITGYVNDPSELQIIGKVTFEPIFAADEVDDGTTTSGMPSMYGAAGTETLVPAGDQTQYVMIALALAALSALMLIVIAARRCREADEE